MNFGFSQLNEQDQLWYWRLKCVLPSKKTLLQIKISQTQIPGPYLNQAKLRTPGQTWEGSLNIW